MATEEVPKLHVHISKPEWGRARLVSELEGKRTFQFEDGLSRAFTQAYWDKVRPAGDIAPAEAKSIAEKLSSLFTTSTTKVRAKKAKAPAEPPATTFEAQIEQFESAFPGGFGSEKYAAAERGAVDQPRSRNGAIALAQAQLEKSVLEGLIAAGDFEGVFARALEVAKSTRNLLHPTGELAPFAALAPELRGEFVRALVEALHGAGPFEARFDRLVGALRTTKPGWPIATLFLALVHPTEHVFVRSTLLKLEAAIVGIDIQYESTPSAAGYARILQVVAAVEERLRAKNHAPKDRMDVLAFMGRTLKGAGKAAKGAKAAAPQVEDDD